MIRVMGIWGWIALLLMLCALYFFVTSFWLLPVKRPRVRDYLGDFLFVVICVSWVSDEGRPPIERILMGCVGGLFIAGSLVLIVRLTLVRARERAKASSQPSQR